MEEFGFLRPSKRTFHLSTNLKFVDFVWFLLNSLGTFCEDNPLKTMKPVESRKMPLFFILTDVQSAYLVWFHFKSAISKFHMYLDFAIEKWHAMFFRFSFHILNQATKLCNNDTERNWKNYKLSTPKNILILLLSLIHIIFWLGIRALSLYLRVYAIFSYKQSSCGGWELSTRAYNMHLKVLLCVGVARCNKHMFIPSKVRYVFHGISYH